MDNTNMIDKKGMKFDYSELENFKEEVLKDYPEKVAKKRAKAIQYIDPKKGNRPEIQANVRTVPGIITQRGCTYAGCKGVVIGPTRDILGITHGPIGCSVYSWLSRRNMTDPGPDGQNFIPYAFSTDMQEQNIVFGGEKKLKQAIREAYELFHPKAIVVFSTCPVGLIGDDVHRASREMVKEFKEKYNKDVTVFGFSCEGYRGVSQSAGHHIANNQLFKFLIGKDDHSEITSKFRINLLGEYNIGGDAFVIEELFKKCGIQLVATMSGDSDVHQFETAHTADLNLVMCHRSLNYIAEMMETTFGIPWMKINFLSVTQTAMSLRKIGLYFNDKELTERIEKVISESMVEVEKAVAEVRPKTQGKFAMLFAGGSRAHHYQTLFAEIGMSSVVAGYEFAHRDDYEGRSVIPNIRQDADARNIEVITVTKDDKRYKERRSKKEMAQMEKTMEDKFGDTMDFENYEGMMSEMQKGSLAIDDVSHHEMQKLIERFHPDIFCAGIKEKYAVEKMGVPLKQIHNYDYRGPYAGFKGAVNFYRDIAQMVTCSIWKELKAPWQNEEYVKASYNYNK